MEVLEEKVEEKLDEEQHFVNKIMTNYLLKHKDYALFTVSLNNNDEDYKYCMFLPGIQRQVYYPLKHFINHPFLIFSTEENKIDEEMTKYTNDVISELTNKHLVDREGFNYYFDIEIKKFYDTIEFSLDDKNECFCFILTREAVSSISCDHQSKVVDEFLVIISPKEKRYIYKNVSLFFVIIHIKNFLYAIDAELFDGNKMIDDDVKFTLFFQDKIYCNQWNKEENLKFLVCYDTNKGNSKEILYKSKKGDYWCDTKYKKLEQKYKHIIPYEKQINFYLDDGNISAKIMEMNMTCYGIEVIGIIIDDEWTLELFCEMKIVIKPEISFAPKKSRVFIDRFYRGSNDWLSTIVILYFNVENFKYIKIEYRKSFKNLLLCLYRLKKEGYLFYDNYDIIEKIAVTYMRICHRYWYSRLSAKSFFEF